jgi:hypothetical protein
LASDEHFSQAAFCMVFLGLIDLRGAQVTGEPAIRPDTDAALL